MMGTWTVTFDTVKGVWAGGQCSVPCFTYEMQQSSNISILIMICIVWCLSTRQLT